MLDKIGINVIMQRHAFRTGGKSSPLNLKGDCFLNKLKDIISRHPFAFSVACRAAVCCVVLILSVTIFSASTANGGWVNAESHPMDQGAVLAPKLVTLDVLGEKTDLVFYGHTVEDLLKFAEVTVPAGAEMSAKPTDAVTDGMTLIIRIVETKQETFTMAIPFETEYVETNYLRKGETVVLTEGSSGTYLCTGTVTYVNGVVVDRTAETYAVQTEAVNALIAVGTGNGKAKEGTPIVGQNKLLTWEGEVLEFTHKDEFKATCYYRFPVDGEITAMGTPTRVGAIAVDPKVIPYWTRMYIVTQDGEYIYGVAVAEDCGTAIKGKWVDLFYETYEEACKFGRRQVDIYFLA